MPFQMTRLPLAATLTLFASAALAIPTMAQDSGMDAEPVEQPVMQKEMKMEVKDAAPEVDAPAMTDTMMPDAAPVATESEMAEPVGEVTTVTVACPEGTTAQDDGTCMMDGEPTPQ